MAWHKGKTLVPYSVQIIDESTQAPISGAQVSLVDSSGAPVAVNVSDTSGVVSVHEAVAYTNLDPAQPIVEDIILRSFFWEVRKDNYYAGRIEAKLNETVVLPLRPSEAGASAWADFRIPMEPVQIPEVTTESMPSVSPIMPGFEEDESQERLGPLILEDEPKKKNWWVWLLVAAGAYYYMSDKKK
jgi:hypothetical protein